MPMSTIFQIVEIGTARSAQCDLGLKAAIIIFPEVGPIANESNIELLKIVDIKIKSMTEVSKNVY